MNTQTDIVSKSSYSYNKLYFSIKYLYDNDYYYYQYKG